MLISRYILIFLLFFSFNSSFIFWLLIELNLLVFVIINSKRDILNTKNDSYPLGLYYFIAQSLGSFMFFVSICLPLQRNFLFNELICLIAILLKLGIFPFFSWFFTFGKNSFPLIFFFLLTLQKFPLLIYLFKINSRVVWIFLLINILAGNYYLMKRRDISETLIGSSVYIGFWLYLFFLHSLDIFIYFFIFYRLSILWVSISKRGFIGICTSFSRIALSWGLIFLLGLPPFTIFFFKFNLLSYFRQVIPTRLFVLLWLISFASLVFYMKNFYFSIIRQVSFLNSSYFLNGRGKVIIFSAVFLSLVFTVFWNKLYKLLSSYLK